MMQYNGNGHASGNWCQLPMHPALRAERIAFIDGASVYEADTAAGQVYFIDSGQVRTYEAGPDESARLMEILGPGDWFGEESLAEAPAYSSRAVAESQTVIWAVTVERLMDLLSREPAVASEFIRRLAMRLQLARQEASAFVFDDCSNRLVKTLLRFSATAAATPEENGAVVLHITHRQLAQAVGAARETISLALTQMRQKNLLRTGRNRLTFRPAALQAYARDGTTPKARTAQ